MRCLHPCVVPIQYAITYMLQSGTYILSSDFILTFKKVDLREAEALWSITFCPEHCTVDQVLQLVFDPRSYGGKVNIMNLPYLFYIKLTSTLVSNKVFY